MSTNLEAARSGDQRQALEQLRDTLARALDECDPNMYAQTAGQYRATLDALAKLPSAEKVAKRDELAKRRAERSANRVAAPPAGASAGRGSKRRSGA